MTDTATVSPVTEAPNCVYKEAHLSTGCISAKRITDLLNHNSTPQAMEPVSKRKFSFVWDHFDLISANKVFVFISLFHHVPLFPLDLPIRTQIRFKVTLSLNDSFSFLQVKCRICLTELSYINKSTSSMLRHYRAKHENEDVTNTPTRNTGIQTFYNFLMVTLLIINSYYCLITLFLTIKLPGSMPWTRQS